MLGGDWYARERLRKNAQAHQSNGDYRQNNALNHVRLPVAIGNILYFYK